MRELRRRVERLRRARGDRFPSLLRERITAWVRARRELGDWWCDLSRAIANWDRLTRFDDDARIPLDNNATERAIRGPYELQWKRVGAPEPDVT